jgi:hypothetical protein
MKQMVSLLFSLFLSSYAFSQALPEFSETVYNYGKIREDKRPPSHEFRFVNKGPADLMIDTVIADCICLSLSWSEESIPAGEEGVVQVFLNPEGMSGNFQKTVEVRFRGLSNPGRLRLVGVVQAGISNPVAFYKKKIGGTRFRSNYLNMGTVANDTSVSKTFDVYNDSDTIITFFEQIGHAKHMDISIEPMALQPGETGKILVKYDASALGKLGQQSDMITIASDEKTREALKYLNIAANVVYAFPEMSDEEKKMAANIRFDKKDHAFGNLIEGEIVETSFTFTNTGKQDLEILQTSVSCGCTAGVADKEIYKPGESGKIDVRFDSSNRQGNQSKYITVYTNAALSPVVRLKITANVETNVPEAE